jgi:acyl-coenzyme A synthetase/AMP-(fatty) acid ligase
VNELVHPAARLVDAAGGGILAGAALRERVAAAAERVLAGPPGLVLALTATTIDAVVRYLGVLHARYPVALLDPGIPPESLHDLVSRFAPVLVLGLGAAPGASEPPPGYRAGTATGLGALWRRAGQAPAPPHPDLALLLTTSGSTGSPKLVRLSRVAVHANAAAIAEALGIDAAQVAPTTLPLHYTYGLSVLHSHLVRGATVVLERDGLLHRGFWNAVSAYGVTSLAAVPYQYQMLRRLRFDPARYPTLRTLTQAGGRLAPELVAAFGSAMSAVGGRMFVMYGQTEATARMTVLPPARLADKPGSVGLPVPGGTMSVRPAAGGIDGELTYHGPNVMMGYAMSAPDLARGDELAGTLATGDLGRLDDEGFIYVTGRLRRTGKVFGRRVNLDDVERMLAGEAPAAVVAGDDRIIVFLEQADGEVCRKTRRKLAAALGTHSSGVDVRSLDALPLQPTGKVDYRRLEAPR